MRTKFVTLLASITFLSAAAAGAELEWLEGTYVFPATGDLASFAEWPIRFAWGCDETNNCTLRYELPGSAVGARKLTVTMTGRWKYPFTELSGDAGSASCTSHAYQAPTCIIQMRQNLRRALGYTLDEVNDFVQRNFPREQWESRRYVATLFSNDPKGVIMKGRYIDNTQPLPYIEPARTPPYVPTPYVPRP